MNVILSGLLAFMIAADTLASQGAGVDARRQGEELLAAGIEQMAAAHWDEARSRLEKALADFQTAGDRRGEARTLKELGNLWYSSDAPARALEIERKGLDLARQLGDRDLQARFLNNLGMAVRATEGDEKAYELFKQSAQLADGQKGSEAVEALALAHQGEIDIARGDAREALPSLEKASKIARGLDDPSLAAWVLRALAGAYVALGDHQEAARLYEEAVPDATAAHNQLGEADILYRWGTELFELGRVEKAAEVSTRAATIAHGIEAKETEGAALATLALAAEALGDSKREEETAKRLLELASDLKNETFHAAAERHLQSAHSLPAAQRETTRLREELTAALGRKDRGAAARVALDLGLALVGESKIAEAAEAFDQSLLLYGELQDATGRAIALQALVKLSPRLEGPSLSSYLTHMIQAAHDLRLREVEAVLLVQLGMDRITARDPQQAVAPLERGLSLAEALGLHEVLTTALDSLAFAEYLLGDVATAARFADRELALAKTENDPARTGSALHRLAVLAADAGDLPRSIALTRASLSELAKAQGSETSRMDGFSTLGTALIGEGDYVEAAKTFGDMAEIARKKGDRGNESLALQFQANALLMQGDRKSAERDLTEALAVSRNLGSQTLEIQSLATLGFLAAWDGDDRRAADFWGQLVEATRKPSSSPADESLNRKLEATSLGSLSRAYANLGESSRALELASSALAAANAQGEAFDRALALDARAYVYLRSEKLAEAEADAREAIRLFEGERAKLGDAELAKVGALDQVSTLYDLLEQVLVRRGKPLEALQVAEQGRAQAFVATLKQSAGQGVVPEPPATVARRLGATLVEYSILHDPTQVLIPGRVGGAQAAFENELLIWVVRPTGEVTLRSVDLRTPRMAGGVGETLAARLNFLLKSLEPSRSEPDRQKPLRDLYDELIAPIAELLPADPEAPVVFVPQGVLFLAPFPMLVDPAGHFLIQRHTLLTAPSIDALSTFRQPVFPARWTAENALIVGNPKVSPKVGALANLSQAEGEARKIAALLAVDPLVGSQAGKERVLRALPSARLVHFASHGLLDRGSRSGLPGALALAPAGDADDGLLTAEEIRGLKLSSSLVVLSACETGRGRISGDGVIGLSRSFLAAGAAGVVTSLWRIPDDEATASLMVDFHRRLLASGDPARALRGAMLAAIAQRQDPRSWAGFTYMGAPVSKR
jgi:CHAT domain-containing protein/tetratricopeptide (TPR) repeat protein